MGERGRGRAGKDTIMTKQTDNDMVPRLALGLTVFLAMKLAPRVFAWWNKRKETQPRTPI